MIVNCWLYFWNVSVIRHLKMGLDCKMHVSVTRHLKMGLHCKMQVREFWNALHHHMQIGRLSLHSILIHCLDDWIEESKNCGALYFRVSSKKRATIPTITHNRLPYTSGRHHRKYIINVLSSINQNTFASNLWIFIKSLTNEVLE